MTRLKLLLGLGTLLSLPLSSRPIWAADSFCSATYITDKIRGEETIDRYARSMQAVNVFAYEFGGDGHILPKSPWVPQEAAALRRDSRLILVTQVNDVRRGSRGRYRGFGAGQIVQAILSDPAQRAQLVRELVAASALADGVEIDYEHLEQRTGPLYTTFLKELRAALPANKRLGVVIQPKTDNLPGGLGRAIDWQAIEPYVDWIRLMAYYYSWATSPPGPVVSYATLKKLANFSLNDPSQRIPRDKARILLSLYGWDWPVQPQGRGLLIRYEEAMAIAQAKGITPARDPASDVLTFRYRADDGVLHEVWVDDAVSMKKRVALLQSLNYPHIDFWHLNTGPSELWEWVRDHTSTACPDLRPPRSASTLELKALSPDSVRVGASSATVRISGVGFSSGTMVLWNSSPRVPKVVSATQLELVLPVEDVESPGLISIEAADRGMLSNALPFWVAGTPRLQSLSPEAARAGTTALTLAVNGRDFEGHGLLRWNGADRPTRIVSGAQATMELTESDLAAPGAALITLFNPTSGQESNALTFRIDGLSASAGAFQPLIYPNPWTSDMGGVVHFTKLPAQSTVKIFTLSARHVQTLSAPQGTVDWDLRNADGQPVASGYYVYVVTTPDGARRRGKLAVVR